MQNVGQLELVNFINPAGLEAIGDTMFAETEASGDPMAGNPGEDNMGTILQGALEQSNVDVVKDPEGFLLTILLEISLI